MNWTKLTFDVAILLAFFSALSQSEGTYQRDDLLSFNGTPLNNLHVSQTASIQIRLSAM